MIFFLHITFSKLILRTLNNNFDYEIFPLSAKVSYIFLFLLLLFSLEAHFCMEDIPDFLIGVVQRRVHGGPKIEPWTDRSVGRCATNLALRLCNLT